MEKIFISLPSGIAGIDLEIKNHGTTFFMFYLVHVATGRRESITGDLGTFVYLQAKNMAAKMQQDQSASIAA